MMQGYSEDPNRQKATLLPRVTQADVQRYHDQHITNNRLVWLVIGDRKLTDLQALQRYGQVVELKKEGGRLSPIQRYMHGEFRRHGVEVYALTGLQECLDFVRGVFDNKKKEGGAI